MSSLKKVGMIFCLSIFSNVLANKGVSNYWPKKSNNLEKIRDLSFEIQTNSLNKLLDSNKEVSAKVYWQPDKKSVELIDYKGKKSDSLKNIFTMKSDIVLGNSFKDYIKNYKFVESNKGWHKYEDPNGLQDNTEILIKTKNNILRVIEKKTVGTNYITYTFKKLNGLNLVKEIEHKAFIGMQSFITTTKVEYKSIEGFTLPKRLSVFTRHKLTTNDINTPERELSEVYEFLNYSINKSSALKYFSTK